MAGGQGMPCCCGGCTTCSDTVLINASLHTITLAISGVANNTCIECVANINGTFVSIGNGNISGTSPVDACGWGWTVVGHAYCLAFFNPRFTVSISYNSSTNQTTITVILIGFNTFGSPPMITWKLVTSGRIDCTNYVSQNIPWDHNNTTHCDGSGSTLLLTIN